MGKMEIKCDAGAINIIKARYERMTGDTCPSERDTSCVNLVTPKFRSYCKKGSCTVMATNDKFKNTCKGGKKFLEVEWSCPEQAVKPPKPQVLPPPKPQVLPPKPQVLP